MQAKAQSIHHRENFYKKKKKLINTGLYCTVQKGHQLMTDKFRPQKSSFIHGPHTLSNIMGVVFPSRPLDSGTYQHNKARFLLDLKECYTNIGRVFFSVLNRPLTVDDCFVLGVGHLLGSDYGLWFCLVFTV